MVLPALIAAAAREGTKAAANKLKKVAADQLKKPRAKTEADVIYNARRRAKRAYQRTLDRIGEGKLSGEDFAKARDYLSSLNKTIKESYAKQTENGKEYSEDIEDIKSALNFASKQEVYSGSESERINQIWKRNIKIL